MAQRIHFPGTDPFHALIAGGMARRQTRMEMIIKHDVAFMVRTFSFCCSAGKKCSSVIGEVTGGANEQDAEINK